MKYQLCILSFIALAIVSCGKKNNEIMPDGMFPLMELSAEKIHVPNDKDTVFSITCFNYGLIYVYEGSYQVIDNGVATTIRQPQSAHNTGKIQGDWYEISTSGNTVTGQISKNDKPTPRGLKFDITIGDVFHSIEVVQE